MRLGKFSGAQFDTEVTRCIEASMTAEAEERAY